MSLLDRDKYKKPQFPDGPFIVAERVSPQEGSSLIDMCPPLRAEDFVRMTDENGKGGDGTMYAALNGGRPVYLRVVSQDGNALVHEDGDGNQYNYELVPVFDVH